MKELTVFFESEQAIEEEIQERLPDKQLFQVKCGYFRGAEKQAPGKLGEDYLVGIYEKQRLVFSLCDGAGMSFSPAQGARRLGIGLADWLHNISLPDQKKREPIKEFVKSELAFVNKTILESPDPSAEAMLPESLSYYQRQVFEKRKAEGSKSVFICGLLDTITDQAMFFWMGDSCLRIWGLDGELTEELDRKNFILRDHWNAHNGFDGTIHCLIGSLHNIKKIVAYSDGFACLDGYHGSWPSSIILNEQAALQFKESGSDDICYIEISPDQQKLAGTGIAPFSDTPSAWQSFHISTNSINAEGLGLILEPVGAMRKQESTDQITVETETQDHLFPRTSAQQNDDITQQVGIKKKEDSSNLPKFQSAHRPINQPALNVSRKETDHQEKIPTLRQPTAIDNHVSKLEKEKRDLRKKLKRANGTIFFLLCVLIVFLCLTSFLAYRLITISSAYSNNATPPVNDAAELPTQTGVQGFATIQVTPTATENTDLVPTITDQPELSFGVTPTLTIQP